VTASERDVNPEAADLTNSSDGGNAPGLRTELAIEDMRDRRLGDFRLIRRLGHGGMAEVYLAEQCSMSRQVALKVLRPELVTEEAHLKRFTQEARTAGGLNHPNIVQVFTIGEAEGVHYIAQEYVQGINLAQYLQREGPPDVRTALQIMMQAAEALKSAGEAKIVHRDIKPENILITRKGVVKVADFGLARLTLGERVNLTQDGITMGTPLYMSPEQINGRELDVRSDIYSFGVTCYHLLAGRPPFRGETAMSLAVKHVNEKPVPIERIRTDLPPSICRVVERMMAKSPTERYANADAVLDDLRRISKALGDAVSAGGWSRLAGLVTGQGSSVGTFFAPWKRNGGVSTVRRIAAAAAACLVVAAIAAGIGWLTRPRNPLLSPAKTVTSEPKADSVVDQYFRAWKLDSDESAWLAVIHHFPHEKHYVEQARAQLARLYLQTDRINQAAEIYGELATPDQPDVGLRARGYAGLAIIACTEGDFSKSHQIIVGDLQPIQEHLDERSRVLVIEAISRNRAALGSQVDAGLENRFQPPPERRETNG
jgi:serine/threonine-protein kinase